MRDEIGFESRECMKFKLTGPNFNMKFSMNCEEE